MATPALNEKLRKVLAEMLARNLISNDIGWEWQDMRTMLFIAARKYVFPALGFVDDGSEDSIKRLQAARTAWNEVVSDGYCVESSNCGKHAAANGFGKPADSKPSASSKGAAI